MAIPSAPNNHNNLYQNPFKGTISLQSMTHHYAITMKYPVL